jgi:hypothetical protein
MLLIMMEQITTEIVTFGKEVKPFEKGLQLSFASRALALPDALRRIMDWRTRYNKRFPEMTLDYRLLMVNTVEDIPDALLAELKMTLVDNM